MSAGNFAVFRSETEAYSRLGPRYGGFARKTHRLRFLRDWFPSEFFLRTGLTPSQIGDKIEKHCRSPADFLRIVLGSVAQLQGADRWIESTPESGLYLKQILRDFPRAHVIHMIRDGRDVAASMNRTKWYRPFFWDRGNPSFRAIAYWDWLVRNVRRFGRQFPDNYCEIHFEDLVNCPSKTLQQLGIFLEEQLDWEIIQRVGIGAVSWPNSFFTEEGDPSIFPPVGRWKKIFSVSETEQLESIAGELLSELGYVRTTDRQNNLSKIVFRSLYRVRFTSRHRLKHCLPFAHKFVESTVLPWKAVPVQDDATLRPGQNLEYIRSIVSGRL